MIEALEKLREWSHSFDNRWLQPDGTVLEVMGDPGVRMGESYGEHIRSMLDAIEAEVAERFMELPVDKDGEVIRIGDMMKTETSSHGWNTRAERTCEVTFKRGAMYDVAHYSCCGYEFPEPISETGVAENFCPNCGARVEEAK